MTRLTKPRLITLLNTIYKIWETVTTRRLTPIWNILTNEMQQAYTSNKSIIDVVYHIKRCLIRRNCECGNPLALSNAFGWIRWTRLWGILYVKGIHADLIRKINQRHGGDLPCSRHCWRYSSFVRNNVGVSHDRPTGGDLCIIYRYRIMGKYKNELI